VKRFLVIVALLVILIIGGGLTMQLIASGGQILPILETVSNPDADRSVVLPWKAEQLFLMIGFLIFNLVGIAATIGIIFWFIDRGVRKSQAEAAEQKAANAKAEG
jgi:predicted membrane protein